MISRLLLLCLAITLPAFAQEAVAPIAVKVCEVADKRIDESSGLVASRLYAEQGLLWTHNDSGGEPKLFLFNQQGEIIADVLLEGAINIDWEDIAYAGGYLYVGDIGDNLRQRENITIYRLREPLLDPHQKGQSISYPCEKMILKYPDGARDAETLIASEAGELLIVSKAGDASRFYKTWHVFENNCSQTLKQVGSYSFTGPTARSYLATGGDLAPGEDRFVMRTYTHAYEWDLSPQRNWNAALAGAPRIWELPESRQGEAICYSADGGSLFVSSEGVPMPVWKITPPAPESAIAQ